MELKDQVLQVFAENGEILKAGDIAERLQVDKALVDKEIKVLKKEEKIHSPKRCFYQVKQ